MFLRDTICERKQWGSRNGQREKPSYGADTTELHGRSSGASVIRPSVPSRGAGARSVCLCLSRTMEVRQGISLQLRQVLEELTSGGCFPTSLPTGGEQVLSWRETWHTFTHTCAAGGLELLWTIWLQETKVSVFFQIEALQFSSVQSLSRVRLFATPWIAARQASLSITNSRSSLKLTLIESVMPSSHLILCHPLFLLPPMPPSIRVFSNESTLRMRWPKYWSFSFCIIPSKEIPELIFRMDWLDLLAVQGTLQSLLQHHSSKASILFTLLIVSFVVQKLLILIRSHLFIFAFISNILGGGS